MEIQTFGANGLRKERSSGSSLFDFEYKILIPGGGKIWIQRKNMNTDWNSMALNGLPKFMIGTEKSITVFRSWVIVKSEAAKSASCK